MSEAAPTVLAMNSASNARTAAWNDQEDRRVAELIRRYGCFIQAVAGGHGHPPFAYTVGLFGLGHPELIIFGLDHESAGHCLNWFFDRIRSGADLTPGEIVEPAGAGTRFLVEEFPDPGAALYAANRHYQRPREASVPAYQLTWDVRGAFPWEPGYPYSAGLQPRRGEYRE
jgi:hypothetical protein